MSFSYENFSCEGARTLSGSTLLMIFAIKWYNNYMDIFMAFRLKMNDLKNN